MSPLNKQCAGVFSIKSKRISVPLNVGRPKVREQSELPCQTERSNAFGYRKQYLCAKFQSQSTFRSGIFCHIEKAASALRSTPLSFSFPFRCCGKLCSAMFLAFFLVSSYLVVACLCVANILAP